MLSIANEPSMNSSSERLVFFVTPAQKRVLAARAARMGISLSELVRRAVLAFDDTGQEVRAAGLVDRLAAASEASRNDTLRRLAQGLPRESTVAQTAEPTHPSSEATSNEATSNDRYLPDAPDSASGDSSTELPVAAAVALALVAQAEAEAEAAARPGEQTDAEMEALVARVIGSSSQGPV